MNGGFTRGLIIGSIIGASVSMMMPETMDNRRRRKMMKTSKQFMRKSGNIIGDVIDIFR